MTIQDDEKLKATCHGLFLGCLLPVLAYNLAARKKRNILVYAAVAVYEVINIIEHLTDSGKERSS